MVNEGEPRPEGIDEDASLVRALRSGDEAAFATLIDRYSATMLRVARGYVATHEAAEDVVQETWLGVLRGLETFEERSTLKTWLFRILVNRARTRGERESRTRPFSALSGADAEPVVDPDRFEATGRWAGFWSTPPPSNSIPEQRVLALEAGMLLIAAIEQLPPNQQIVISLRDVQGLDSTEVCDMLEISEGNQRVLLHRARGKVRAAFERYIDARDLS